MSNLTGDIDWNFHVDDVFILTSLIFRTLSSQCGILLASCLSWLAVKQHWALREKWTCSTSKPVLTSPELMFHFPTYPRNSFKHLFRLSRCAHCRACKRIHCSDHCIGHCCNSTAKSLLINKFPWSWTNFFTRNLYIIKDLSPYTGCISEWMAFAPSPFAYRKQIIERCSLWDAFNGNVAIFNVYTLRQSDVIVTKLTRGIQN